MIKIKHLCHLSDSDKIYNVYSLTKSMNEIPKDILINITQDIDTTIKINHPSILKFMGYRPTDLELQVNPTFITELTQDDTLSQILIKQKLNKVQKSIIIYGIASAMFFLHSHDIIHCNLNLESVLLDSNFYPKLTSFEFSQKVSHKKPSSQLFTKYKGLYSYLAPEIITKHEYSKSSDVYAFSLLMHDMMGISNEASDNVFKIVTKERVKNSYLISEFYNGLIAKCSSNDPEKRPTFDEILDALRNNDDMMKETDFHNYVQFIDNSQSEFDPTKQFNEFDSIISCFNCSQINNDFSNIYDVPEEVLKERDYLDFTQEEIHNFIREANIISKLNHPAIEQFIDFNETKIITKSSNYGNLEYILKNSYLFPFWNDTMKLINIYGIASAMAYLHSYNIIHRDLKPENISFDENLFPKISGFLISKQLPPNILSQTSQNIKGTPAYIAPEVYLNNLYCKAGDVYAFSLIVYEIVTGQKFCNNFSNVNQIIDEVVTKGKRPELNNKIPECYKNLICQCWSQNPDERPSFDKIVRSLKEDPNFITEKVNKEDYYYYIKYIENSHISFDSNKPKYQLDDIESLESYSVYVPCKSIFQTEAYQISKGINYVDLKNLEKKAKIGDGLNFKAYKSIDKRSNLFYATLISKKKYKEMDFKERFSLFRRINFMLPLNHPCIVKTVGISPVSFSNKNKPAIITEFYPNGSISEIVEDNRLMMNSLDFTKKMINIYGIAAGMAYLHSNDIIHCDLRPSNIMLDDFSHPKIIDFNMAEHLNDNHKSKIREFTLYTSPESFNENYCKEGDVYSFGMTIYSILTCKNPFNETNNIYQLLKCVVINGERPEINNDVPNCLKTLIEKCWDKDPTKRPTFSEIVQFLKNNANDLDLDHNEYYEYINYVDNYKSTFSYHQKFDQTNLDEFHFLKSYLKMEF